MKGSFSLTVEIAESRELIKGLRALNLRRRFGLDEDLTLSVNGLGFKRDISIALAEGYPDLFQDRLEATLVLSIDEIPDDAIEEKYRNRLSWKSSYQQSSSWFLDRLVAGRGMDDES